MLSVFHSIHLVQTRFFSVLLEDKSCRHKKRKKKSPDAEKLCSWLDDRVEGVGEVSRKGQHVIHAEAHLFHQVVHLVRLTRSKGDESGATYDMI